MSWQQSSFSCCCRRCVVFSVVVVVVILLVFLLVLFQCCHFCPASFAVVTAASGAGCGVADSSRLSQGNCLLLSVGFTVRFSKVSITCTLVESSTTTYICPTSLWSAVECQTSRSLTLRQRSTCDRDQLCLLHVSCSVTLPWSSVLQRWSADDQLARLPTCGASEL